MIEKSLSVNIQQEFVLFFDSNTLRCANIIK